MSKLVTFVKDKDAETITTDDLRRFMSWLATDYKPNRANHDSTPLRSASLARCWAALRSFWRWAVAEFDLNVNAAAKLKMPKVSSRVILPLGEDDVRKLLKACERSRSTTARDQALIVVLLDTGLRASELARLKIRDADLNTGQVEVRSVGSGTKSKSRVVILGKSARRYVWRYLASRDDDHDQDAPLLTLKDGRPMDRGNIRNAVARLGKRAGVRCHPHQFRHTFAITFLRNGGDVFTLQAILGHSDLQMVRHYAQVAQVDITEAHKRASPADKWRL